MIATYYYNKEGQLLKDLGRADMLDALKSEEGVLWVDLESPTDFESEALVEIFNFHPLAVEDCLSERSEPKVDDYGEYLFIVMHALTMRTDEDGKKELGTIELHLFLGENFVVTFHKEPVSSIAGDRALIERKPKAYMGHGADLLTHTLLDHLVDRYLPMVTQYDDKIDELEKEIFNNPSSDFLETILQVKQDIFVLRRMLGPQRTTVHYLTRNQTAFIRHKHQMYFRDIYDHLFHIYNTTEGLYENLTSILQVYFSFTSNRLNEVMKRLTIAATLTMPAVVIASIYGMNFENMPFLHGSFGFFYSIALMFGVSGLMILWMKKKKWI